MTGRSNSHAGQDGAISIMAAVLAVAMIMATSLAVDVGRVAYSSRDQQGVTDRAVLDALRHLGDDMPDTATTPGEIWAVVSDSVATTLEGNRESSSEGTSSERVPAIIEIGYTDASCVYDPADPQPGDPEDFCVVYSQDGEGPYYADYQADPDLGEKITTVRVVTESAVDFVFAFLDEDGGRDVIKDALGTNRRECTHPADLGCPPPPPPCTHPSDECPQPDPQCPDDACLMDAEAGITIASRLVELNTGDSVLDSHRLRLLRRVLGFLIGHSGEASVTAVGFDGLATTAVPFDVLRADATVGSVDQLLDSQITIADLLTAMASGATASDPTVQTNARTALTNLAADVSPSLSVRVGDMLAATTTDPSALLDARVNTLDLLVHALLNTQLVNGEHLLQLTLDKSVLGSDVFGLPGLSRVTLDLEVIESPQMAYGPVRYDEVTGRYETVARTAQLALSSSVRLNEYYVDDLLGPLSSLLTRVLCVAGPLLCPNTTFDVGLSAAQAEAELAGIVCTDPTSESDITTIVTSESLTATLDSGTETIVGLHDPSNSTLLITEVPGEGEVIVDTGTLTNIPALDNELQPVLGLLGISTGTARVSADSVRCDVPVLMEEPLPTD